MIVVDASMPQEEALRRLKERRAPRHGRARELPQALVLPHGQSSFDVVAVDCGIKHNIIRKLNEKGCNVTVVPTILRPRR